MPPLTASERVARHRYLGRVEKAIEKLVALTDNMPSNFDIRSIDRDLLDALIDGFALMTGSSPEFTIKEDQIGIQFLVPVRDGFLKNLEYPQDEKFALRAYYQWVEEGIERQIVDKNMKRMTRNAFCKEVLGAEMANPRWAWVGVKERKGNKPGSLFIFAWEHDLNQIENGYFGLFPAEVSVDKNNRKRPGHRDALSKIERVQSGELIPYIVWQTAADPKAAIKKIEGINGLYITECELFEDKDSYWNAKLGNEIRL